MRRGVTILEVVVSIGLLAIVLSLGIFFGLDSYRRYMLRTERDNLVTILRRARSEAQNNIGQANHGVFIDDDKYVIFRGNSFAARNADYDENFPRSSGMTFGGIGEVVFGSLSASSNVSGTIVIGNGIQNFDISVNYEGRID